MFSSSANRNRPVSRNSGGGDGRRLPREECMKSAVISIDGSDVVKPCTIRDINAGGVRLSTAALNELPPQFTIIYKAENLVASGQIAWKKADEIGVKFLRKGNLTQEEDFKRRQKQTYEDHLKKMAEQANPQSTLQQRQEAQAIINHYRTMGLDPTLGYTAEQIKKRYRVAAQQAHPDLGGSVEAFQALNAAYSAIIARIESPAT